MNSYSQIRRQSGFTLLEVLLAIGITAMIGLGSWQILNSAIRASDATQLRLGELNAAQKALLIISRDMQQLVSRSVRDEYGDYQPAITTKNDRYLLEFSRNGWRNPMDDPRSTIQRVAYEFNENKLLRHYWLVLDRAQDSQPISKTLLTGVKSISMRYMKESGGWTEQWPADDAGSNSGGGEAPGNMSDPRLADNVLPKALEISLELELFGKIKRLYPVVAYLPGIDIPQTDGTGQGGGSGDGSGSGLGSGSDDEQGGFDNE